MKYTFIDLSCAREILRPENKHLYIPSYLKWAQHVTRYFEKFYKLLSWYHEYLNDYQMAVKALHKNLETRTLEDLYKSYKVDHIRWQKEEEQAKEEKRLQRLRTSIRYSSYDNDNDQVIRSRAGKYNRRTKVRKQTDWFHKLGANGHSTIYKYNASPAKRWTDKEIQV